MNKKEKVVLIEEVLMRASEQVGDVTALALEAFFHRYPQAQAAFESIGGSSRAKLEGQMIENSIYCLMYWVESPREIEIMLSDSVLHHLTTLNIPADWFAGLIDATAEIVTKTIPAENAAELVAWEEVRSGLLAVIEKAALLEGVRSTQL